eukprot:EG_transcript_40929
MAFLGGFWIYTPRFGPTNSNPSGFGLFWAFFGYTPHPAPSQLDPPLDPPTAYGGGSSQHLLSPPAGHSWTEDNPPHLFVKMLCCDLKDFKWPGIGIPTIDDPNEEE